jgi:hypothetical protein
VGGKGRSAALIRGRAGPHEYRRHLRDVFDRGGGRPTSDKYDTDRVRHPCRPHWRRARGEPGAARRQRDGVDHCAHRPRRQAAGHIEGGAATGDAIGVLFSPTAPSHRPALQAIETAGQKLGVQLQLVPVRTTADFDETFATMAQEGVDGCLVVVAPLFTRSRLT